MFRDFREFRKLSEISEISIEKVGLPLNKNKDYIQYFKAWNASFNYKGFNLDMNNDIEFECVPNALFKTYGTKKEISNQYLHSVHKGGLDYVKNVLNRNNTTQKETPINYVNPYD